VFWLFEHNHFTEKGLFVYLSSFLEITILTVLLFSEFDTA